MPKVEPEEKKKHESKDNVNKDDDVKSKPEKYQWTKLMKLFFEKTRNGQRKENC